MKTNPTLKQILLDHINATQGWQSKGSLYMVGEMEEFSPESVGRELRYLEEDKQILVSYYKGKRKQKLARYAKLGESMLPPTPKIQIVEEDGKIFARMNTLDII